MHIRPEGSKDYGAIQYINDEAFGSTEESTLVRNLRKHPAFLPELSLVAELDGTPVGHLLLFPVTITDKTRTWDTLALAPMAVLPKHQNEGVGSALVRRALQSAAVLGYESVVVLGHPEYYPRFGFKLAEGFGIFPPAYEWKQAFFILELKEHALRGVRGTVTYPPEFGI